MGRRLFIVVSGFHLLIGLLAPILGLPPEIVGLGPSSDVALYGRSSEELLRDPVVLGLRWHHTVVVGGLLVGLGVMGLGLSWYGLARRSRWALMTLFVAYGAMLPYWVLMLQQYATAGLQVALGEVQPFVIVPTVLFLPATILCWVGLRSRTQTPERVRARADGRVGGRAYFYGSEGRALIWSGSFGQPPTTARGKS
jgi:hypothetical protein